VRKAIFLDLDDTIVNDSGSIDACWRDACTIGAAECAIPPDRLFEAIKVSSKWYWADPERHRLARLDLQTAPTEVVCLALKEFGIDDDGLAARIGPRITSVAKNAWKSFRARLRRWSGFATEGSGSPSSPMETASRSAGRLKSSVSLLFSIPF
jgi:hypothetical protein